MESTAAIFTAAANARSMVVMPVASAGTALPGRLPWLAAASSVPAGARPGPGGGPAVFPDPAFGGARVTLPAGFAPLASATGGMGCRGFWEHGKPDKGGIWTSNRELAPGLACHVERIGATFGRVWVIKLNPSDEAAVLRQPHCDDNNRLNPDGAGWGAPSWLALDDAPGQSSLILPPEKDR